MGRRLPSKDHFWPSQLYLALHQFGVIVSSDPGAAEQQEQGELAVWSCSMLTHRPQSAEQCENAKQHTPRWRACYGGSLFPPCVQPLVLPQKTIYVPVHVPERNVHQEKRFHDDGQGTCWQTHHGNVFSSAAQSVARLFPFLILTSTYTCSTIILISRTSGPPFVFHNDAGQERQHCPAKRNATKSPGWGGDSPLHKAPACRTALCPC